MSVTVLEALQNADYNLRENGKMGFAVTIAKTQLRNAVVLLEKGYSPHDEVEPLLDAAGGNVDDVPEKPA